MSWLKIDDQFADHPKILAVGPLGLAIYIRSLCYCSRYLTNGFIPEQAVPAITNGMKNINIEIGEIGDVAGLIDEADQIDWPANLVDAGLWEKTEAGYRIHDYLHYNPSKNEVLEAREIKKERNVAGGVARAASANRLKGKFLPATDQPNASQEAGNCVVPKHQRKTSSPSPSPSPTKEEIVPFESIILYLNKKTGKNFRHATPKYQQCIRARWDEGFRMLDFHKVITNRIEKWGGDPKMAEYLRPETLFGTKFQGYLNDYGAEYGVQPQATPKEEIDGLYE